MACISRLLPEVESSLRRVTELDYGTWTQAQWRNSPERWGLAQLPLSHRTVDLFLRFPPTTRKYSSGTKFFTKHLYITLREGCQKQTALSENGKYLAVRDSLGLDIKLTVWDLDSTGLQSTELKVLNSLRAQLTVVNCTFLIRASIDNTKPPYQYAAVSWPCFSSRSSLD